MSIILFFECSTLGPKSIGESLEESTTDLRRCKESTPHQYLRHRSKEHKNPMNQHVMLQCFYTNEDLTLWLTAS